jgi:serine phosphatase RsbU (regulator of sigma subunit)
MMPWVRRVLATLLIANALWMPLPFLTSDQPMNWVVGFAGSSLAFVGTSIALLVLRRGALHTAVLISAIGLLLGCAVGLTGWGLYDGAGILAILALPIMLAALLATQRGLAIIAGLAMLLVAAVGWLERAPIRLAGLVSLGANRSIITVGSFILANFVLAVFLQWFSRSLREALASALNRQQELEAYRDRLEELVSVRTAELTAANVELHRLAQQLKAHNDELLTSLELARDIQIGLLPNAIPWDRQRLGIQSYSLPAFDVGGDFYAYAALDPSRIAVAIGDISGKGVSAALIMSLTLSLLEERMHQIGDPGALITTLNRQLTPRLQHNRMNAALLCMLIDLEQCTLSVANAGMITPMILRNGAVQHVDVGGFPVGSIETCTYQTIEYALDPSDLILLMSDGVVEAHNADRELFGFARLEQALQQSEPMPTPDQVIATLTARVTHFMGEAKQHDDITIIVLQPHRD